MGLCSLNQEEKILLLRVGSVLSTRVQVFLVPWGRWALPSLLSLPASCVRNFWGGPKSLGFS